MTICRWSSYIRHRISGWFHRFLSSPWLFPADVFTGSLVRSSLRSPGRRRRNHARSSQVANFVGRHTPSKPSAPTTATASSSSSKRFRSCHLELRVPSSTSVAGQEVRTRSFTRVQVLAVRAKGVRHVEKSHFAHRRTHAFKSERLAGSRQPCLDTVIPTRSWRHWNKTLTISEYG